MSFPPDGGLQCYDPVKKEYFFVKYDDSKGYVAFSPQSAKRLFDQCFKKKQGGLLSEPESEELEPEESNSTPEEESVLVDWDELRESYPEYYQDDVLDETSPSDIDLDQDL